LREVEDASEPIAVAVSVSTPTAADAVARLKARRGTA
jgi:hypothetical protein